MRSLSTLPNKHACGTSRHKTRRRLFSCNVAVTNTCFFRASFQPSKGGRSYSSEDVNAETTFFSRVFRFAASFLIPVISSRFSHFCFASWTSSDSRAVDGDGRTCLAARLMQPPCTR